LEKICKTINAMKSEGHNERSLVVCSSLI